MSNIIVAFKLNESIIGHSLAESTAAAMARGMAVVPPQGAKYVRQVVGHEEDLPSGSNAVQVKQGELPLQTRSASSYLIHPRHQTRTIMARRYLMPV